MMPSFFEDDESFLSSPGLTFSTSIASPETSLPMVLLAWGGEWKRERERASAEGEKRERSET